MRARLYLNEFVFEVQHLTGLVLLALLMGLLLQTAKAESAVKSVQVKQTRTSTPFKTLLGSWKGSGTFSLQDGTKERISCNAYYTGGGSQLRLAILCSSPSNKIHMRGKLSYNGGHLTGSWEERTFHAEGVLKGKATSKRLKMTISGIVTGTMLVSIGKRKQSVKIETAGSNLKTVSIKLAR